MKKEDDIVNLIFDHKPSRLAARALIEWLKGKGGSCTHTDMNKFSHMLASGTIGCSLSRANFYGTILHRLLDLGLIAEQKQYDYKMRRASKVYMRVFQPIPKKRPMGPSLTLIAHLIAERWNDEFTGTRGG